MSSTRSSRRGLTRTAQADVVRVELLPPIIQDLGFSHDGPSDFGGPGVLKQPQESTMPKSMVPAVIHASSGPNDSLDEQFIIGWFLGLKITDTDRL